MEKALRILKTLEQANSKPDEANNDKCKNQRIVDDCTNKRANPRDGRRDKRSNIAKDSCNGSSSLAGINNLPSCLN